MVTSTVGAILRKWLLNVFLPWFSEAVWPLLQAAALDVINDLIKKLREILMNRGGRREEDARKRAAEAELKAKAASSGAEMEKHEAIAAVWRQVAEEFRQENEDLKRQLEAFVKDSKRSVSRQINRLKSNVKATQSTLEIGNRRVPLLNAPGSRLGRLAAYSPTSRYRSTSRIQSLTPQERNPCDESLAVLAADSTYLARAKRIRHIACPLMAP